jgi:hypothetical protein
VTEPEAIPVPLPKTVWLLPAKAMLIPPRSGLSGVVN